MLNPRIFAAFVFEVFRKGLPNLFYSTENLNFSHQVPGTKLNVLNTVQILKFNKLKLNSKLKLRCM